MKCKMNGIYVCTGEVGEIVPGAQQKCPICKLQERQAAWMQVLDYGQEGRYWQCIFIGHDGDGKAVMGGCGFAFPMDLPWERVEVLVAERMAFLREEGKCDRESSRW